MTDTPTPTPQGVVAILTDLAGRLERGERDLSLEDEIDVALSTLQIGSIGRVAVSIDAAVALCNGLLTGWSWEIRRSGFGEPSQADVWDPRRGPTKQKDYRVTNGKGRPAASLCAAVFRAYADNYVDA